MLQVIGLPAFSDNIIWLIGSSNPLYAQQVWVVDPGESTPLLAHLDKHNLTLSGILLTHHHADHVGGVADLLAAFPHKAVPVIGPMGRFPLTSQVVNDGDELLVLGHPFKVIATPGHTMESLCFLNQQALFCGDTLFTAGCGRCFSGNFDAFAASLLKLKQQVPADALVYCAHEYAWANCQFAKIAEPDNKIVRARSVNIQKMLSKSHFCIPLPFRIELESNPFLRFNQPPLKDTLLAKLNQSSASEGELFKTLRNWKDGLDSTGILEMGLMEIATK